MSEQAIPFVLERGARDGCDCPPWIIRCAHLGEYRVILADNAAPIPGCVCPYASGPGFSVIWFQEPISHCLQHAGCSAPVIYRSKCFSMEHFDKRNAANAAFDAAELALLRGDA